MPTYKFEKGYSSYGADMGREEWGQAPQTRTVRLFEAVLDSGGYDTGGAYWGTGEPLWCALAICHGVTVYRAFVRAGDRKQAAQELGLTNKQLTKGA